jgi:hypothetical protein
MRASNPERAACVFAPDIPSLAATSRVPPRGAGEQFAGCSADQRAMLMLKPPNMACAQLPVCCVKIKKNFWCWFNF